jgi:hypothetical protein
MFATPLRHALRHTRPNQVSRNVPQRRFRPTGSGLIFYNPLILMAFCKQREKENGYEEGCTRGVNFIFC